MNYEFTGPTIAYVAGDRVIRELVEFHDYDPYPALNAEEYGQKILELLNLYPWEIQLAQLNLLDSHDTRAWSPLPAKISPASNSPPYSK